MKQKSGPGKAPAEQVLKDIRRQTHRQYSAEEKIRIVLEGLRGEENISELCRREGIAFLYYGWSKEFLEAGRVPCRPRLRSSPSLSIWSGIGSSGAAKIETCPKKTVSFLPRPSPGCHLRHYFRR
jgi:hypothetical protein